MEGDTGTVTPLLTAIPVPPSPSRTGLHPPGVTNERVGESVLGCRGSSSRRDCSRDSRCHSRAPARASGLVTGEGPGVSWKRPVGNGLALRLTPGVHNFLDLRSDTRGVWARVGVPRGSSRHLQVTTVSLRHSSVFSLTTDNCARSVPATGNARSARLTARKSRRRSGLQKASHRVRDKMTPSLPPGTPLP